MSVQNFLSLGPTVWDQPILVKVIVSLLILLVGYLVGKTLIKIVKSGYRYFGNKEMIEKIKQRGKRPYKYLEYCVSVVTISLALIYLNSSATNQLFVEVLQSVPSVLTAVLVFILGFLVVKLLMDLLTGFIETLGIKRYARDLGLSPKMVSGFFKAIEVFLYLVVLEISVIQLGVSSEIIGTTLTAASYGAVAVIGLLLFFGFKDIVQNYAAGIYLKSSEILKPGKKVKFEEESGEIRDISSFGTTIATDTGYFMLAPNKDLMDKKVMFKRVKADIETLEDIKSYFVSQEPSYCGPASIEMALAMFGYDISQERIAGESGTEQPGGVKPQPLIDAVEKLTNGEVRGAFVEYDNITGLAEEFKIWFNDDALIIPNFAKTVLFPDADTAHYSLSLGVEGDELLIVDPSAHTVSGGVYYVDGSEMLDAMSEHQGRERGYLVLAPKGTTAYWRIKNDLIYCDTGKYEQLSKSLEMQLGRIMRRGRILKDVMPEQVEEFLGKWRGGERVDRVWKPRDLEGGDKKLDEFTSSDE